MSIEQLTMDCAKIIENHNDKKFIFIGHSMGTRIAINLSYKLRKSKDGWKIVNIIINGVNLGLTFRNQFQALAVSHNENISDTLRNWVSDAGTAGIT